MKTAHPEGDFETPVIDPTTKVVCVNLARAGTVPSQICFDAFNYILDAAGVQDIVEGIKTDLRRNRSRTGEIHANDFGCGIDNGCFKVAFRVCGLHPRSNRLLSQRELI